MVAAVAVVGPVGEFQVLLDLSARMTQLAGWIPTVYNPQLDAVCLALVRKFVAEAVKVLVGNRF